MPLFKLGIPASAVLPIDAAIITCGVGVIPAHSFPSVIVITRSQWLFVSLPSFTHGAMENI